MTPPLSDHFNGKTFFQPHRAAGRLVDFWRWRLTAKPVRWPDHVPLVPQPRPLAARGDEVIATWIGHASFLLQTARANFLIDPVFSERASPFTWIGPRRAHPPGLSFENLPRIAFVRLPGRQRVEVKPLHLIAAGHFRVDMPEPFPILRFNNLTRMYKRFFLPANPLSSTFPVRNGDFVASLPRWIGGDPTKSASALPPLGVTDAG